MTIIHSIQYLATEKIPNGINIIEVEVKHTKPKAYQIFFYFFSSSYSSSIRLMPFLFLTAFVFILLYLYINRYSVLLLG
jgi:hypothetical protein